MALTDKLEQLKERYFELEGMLGSPDATSDMDKFTAMNKEYSDLRPIVEAFDEYSNMLTEREDLQEMMNDADADAEMKEMATMEFQELKDKIPAAEKALEIILLPKDKNDDKNAIIEVRAGAGGDEAALFAADVFRMYTRFAELQGWKVEIMDQSMNDIGGIKEVSALLSGPDVYAKMKYESGGHRVQRVPDTETQGRVHTSAITVAVLPEAEEVDIDIRPQDLRIDVYRASGAGGQHVNKTESAVRITHIPTGIVAQCQDQSSQHKNKATALKVLYARIYEVEQGKIDEERAADRKGQVGSGDRSERIRTYNFPQGRVTDHRINLTLHNLNDIIAGDKLGELIEQTIVEDEARRLAALGEDS